MTLSEIVQHVAAQESRPALWLEALSLMGVRQMLEVGVWKGHFARRTLEGCPSIERYYMIDPWVRLPDWNKPYNVEQERFDDVYREAMDSVRDFRDKVTVLRGRTTEVIEQIPDGSLDFAYIDGDHTLRGITIDLIRVLPKIKEGGFIGGDDFTTNPWQHSQGYEPTLVCPLAVYFAEAMDVPIAALAHEQFLLQKSTGGEFIDTTGGYSDLSLGHMAPRRKRTPRMVAGALLRRLGLRK